MKDKIIVITGGAKGLGRALAQAFVSKEAKVVVSDIDEAALTTLAQELPITTVVADVTQEQDVMALSKKVLEMFGRYDVWINNAGLWIPPMPLENMDLEKVKKMFEVNVFGTIHGMRIALTEMKKQNHGTIVNIISTTAFDKQYLLFT